MTERESDEGDGSGDVGRSRPRLDPLPGDRREGPRASASEAKVRMVDVQMAWDVAVAVRDRPRGARRRVAEKHGVVPATITQAVARFELALGVPLFARGPDDEQAALSVHGEVFLTHGATFLRTYQLLRRLVQDAE